MSWYFLDLGPKHPAQSISNVHIFPHSPVPVICSHVYALTDTDSQPEHMDSGVAVFKKSFVVAKVTKEAC